MRITNLGARCAGLLLLLLALACNAARADAACAGPQRLCAPGAANTRAPAAVISFARSAGATFAAAAVALPLDPELQAKRLPRAAAAAPANADERPGAATAAGAAAPAATTPTARAPTTQTATAPASPAPASAASGTRAAAGPAATPVTRLALLLPMRSATLAGAADAVRAGFMAGMERDGAGFTVDIVSTGDAPRDVLDAYARAAAAGDIVIGPLSRAAVGALVDNGDVAKPTIALSAPDSDKPLPRKLLVAGLTVEDEARQVADWAAQEHPHGRALVLTGAAAWAQRAAGAFEARWTALGHTSQRFALPAGAAVDGTDLDMLAPRLEIDPPDLLFAALDASELARVRRQVPAAAAALPCYGGGAANPGRTPADGSAGLAGVRILDLPWIVRPDHVAVMVYPRPLNTEQPLDMDRLYALGIDAFRVAREIALHPGAPFALDGVTGRLTVGVDADTGQLRLQRREAAAVVRDGGFEPVERGP